MMDKNKKRIMPPLPLGPEGLNIGMIRTDPYGSYLGRGEDPYEEPVQDVDDL